MVFMVLFNSVSWRISFFSPRWAMSMSLATMKPRLKYSWLAFASKIFLFLYAEVHFLRLDFCGGHYVAKKNEEQQKMIPATAHTTYRPWSQHSTLSVVKCGLLEGQCPSIRVSWSQPAKSTARTSIATRHTKSASHRCCGTKHQIVYLSNSLKRHCVAKKCKPKK